MENKKPILSQNTIDKYESNYARLKQNIKPLTMGKFVDYIKKYETSTQLSYISSMIYGLRKDGATKEIALYEQLYKKLEAPFRAKYKYKDPSDKEKANAIKLQDVVAIRESLKNKDDPKAQLNHLILSLYTMFPPLRGGEYLNMVYYDGDDLPDDPTKLKELLQSHNVIDLSAGKFIIVHYKTAKRYGRRELTIPNELLKIIKQFYFRQTFPDDRKPLFGREFSNSALTKKLNELLGKKASVDELRKAYITENAPKMTKDTRKKLAFIMAHSIDTQELIYHK